MLGIRKSALFTMLLAAVIILPGCGDGGDRQEKYLERGQENFDEGNYDKARIELKNVLQINPNNAKARYLLGLIEVDNQNWRAAFGNFQGAISADETYIDPKISLARLYLTAQQMEKAQELVDEILALDPNSGEAIGLNAGIVLIGDKETDKAFELAQKAIALLPTSIEAVQVLARVYIEREQPEKAIEVVDAALALETKPNRIETLKVQRLGAILELDDVARMSQAMEQLIKDYPDEDRYAFSYINYFLSNESLTEDERKDQAEGILNKLIAENPEKEVYKLWMTEFLTKNRDISEGLEKLKSYVEAQPDVFSLRKQLASVYIKSGDQDAAKALFNEVIQQDAESADATQARIQLAGMALRENDTDKALEYIEEILNKDPENLQALLFRGEISLGKDNTDAAISDSRRALRSDPSSEPGLLLLARAYEKTGSIDLALDNYQGLIQVAPTNIPGLLGAARLFMGKNRLDEATQALEQAQKIQPKNLEAIRMLTDIYSRDQRWDDAIAISGRLLEDDASAAFAHYLQGRTYIRKRDLDKAISSLEKSLDLDSRIIESLTALISAYNATNQTVKSISYLENHIKNNPDHDHAVELLAGVYNSQKNYKDAEKLLTDLVKKSPERLSAYQGLYRFYIQQERFDDSERILKNGIAASEKNKNLLLVLAEYYQFRERFQDAVDAYEEILEANPDSDVIKNNMASLIVDYFPTDENIARAVELTSGFSSSDNPAFLDTAGWVQYHQGNYPQAISLLQGAVAQGGTGPIYYYHLGMAYLKNDMLDSAKDTLAKALADKDLDFRGKEQAQKALDSL